MPMIMSAFRRSMYAEAPHRRGGGGTKGNWRDQRKLQKEATPIVLIDATYVDPAPTDQEIQIAGVDPTTGQPNPVMKRFFRVRKHKCKTKRNGKDYYPDEVCSAGWNRSNPQPCAGCQAADSGDKRITTADQFAIGFVHLVPYHTHPLYDFKKNQWVMKNDNSGPFMTESECEGRTCNFCRVLAGHPPTVLPGTTWPGYDPRSIGTKFGGRRYLELGKGHLENLYTWADQIASKCANIDPQTGRLCRTTLRPVGFDCPDCNSVVIDLASDPRNDQQIAEAVSRPYPCMVCRQQKWLRQALICDRCEQRDMDPSQFPLFGTVLHGARRGEGKNSTLFLDEFQSIEEYEQQTYNQFGGLYAGRSLRSIVEELSKPFDFSDLYAPRSLEEQRRRLDIQAPQQGGYQQGGYYGGPQQPQWGAPQPQQGGYPPVPQQYQQPQYPQQPQQGPNQGPQPTPPFVPGRPNYS